MSVPVFINGRFLSATPSGVQRVAAQLVRATDQLLRARPEGVETWSLLTPRHTHGSLTLESIAVRAAGRSTWQIWEQFELPWLARRGRLLNLCNTAPLAHPDSIVMMHDAQVFTTPRSYSSALRMWYRFLQPELGKTARKIVTVSEFSKSQLIEFGVAQEEKIAVISNGVDHLYSTRGDSDACFRFGLVGIPYVVALANAQSHKNISVLLRAFSDARLKDMRLVLVGRAAPEDFEDPVRKNVVFVGPVSDAELKGLMEEALCLAFPSLTEGFGLPPLEAMASGCPAVVAPCGALPEVCGSAAIYAPPNDVIAWIEIFEHLAISPSTRSELIIAGKKQASKFTWRNSAEKLLALVEEA